MRDDESIQDMHTRFTSIINELHSLDEIIPRNKIVRKILSFLPSSWESKVNSITESKDLQELTVEELIGNLKTHELKKKINSERREPKREKNLVLKADYNDSSEEDSDMAYLTKIFQKMVRRNGEMLKRDISVRPRNWDLCYNCGKFGHFMKDCPLLKQEFSKNHHEKIAETNSVPVKDFKRKRYVDKMMRQALAALRDLSSESEDEPDTGDSSMMAFEGEKTGYDSIFAFMAQSNDDEDNGNKEDRDSLTLELGESEQTRGDLVAVVTDHKKTIEILRKEKSDLLAEIADLRETIVKPWTKSKPESSGKGKEIVSEEHIRLENEVKAMRFRMCAEIEKNELLQTNLKKGYILGVGKVGKSLTHSIENVYYVNSLKYSLLSVSQICDKGNKVEFLSKICTVTDLVTGEIVFVAKRYKNIYVTDFESLQNGDTSCLKAIDDETELWHRRMGHASFSLLNKLIQKDLVHGLPMSQFKMQKVCDACASGKDVKSSFKPKRDVSTSKPLELLHMDLCGPMRVQSR
ncbi:uncharacterized protein [Nicotiana sylvestris]|uniref:uncharacterized protein n=1 Tax=Nicotiana sylvestris TaxID=4096 RepID=UPI00388CCC83